MHTLAVASKVTSGGSSLVLPGTQGRPRPFPNTGNSPSKRLCEVRAAQSQNNALKLLSTKLQPSSQLCLARLLPPPHFLARHSSSPAVLRGELAAHPPSFLTHRLVLQLQDLKLSRLILTHQPQLLQQLRKLLHCQHL